MKLDLKIKNKMKLTLEYIWLDNSKIKKLKSKIKIIDSNYNSKKNLHLYKNNIQNAPITNFYENEKELFLIPVNYFNNPFYKNSLFVLCEVYDFNNELLFPHISNDRHDMVNIVNDHDDETIYNYKQQYYINNRLTTKYNNPINYKKFIKNHIKYCLKTNLYINEYKINNTDKMEYSIGPFPAIDGSDQLWISRYILMKISDIYNYDILFENNNLNMNFDFSTKTLRDCKNEKNKIIEDMCEKLSKNHSEHLKSYNKIILNKNSFSYGSDMSNSIKIPKVNININSDINSDYIQDNRPLAYSNPYDIVKIMIETICK